MRIEENRVFVFSFDTTQMGTITLPVRGETREKAAEELQAILSRIQTEVAMEFPKVAAGTAEAAVSGVGNVAPNAAQGLSIILEERIDTLLTDLGAGALTPAAKAKTVKNWTELAYEPENFATIVHELELIASGQKVVPAPKEKK